MLGPRAKAQDYHTVGRPHVHCQATGLRTESARRLHTDPHAIVERAIVEAVLAGFRIQTCPKVVAALRESGFASAESALTGRTARVHGRSIQVGDVVLYTGGGPNGGCTDTRVGEVFFHAVLHDQVLVGLSHRPLKRAWPHWIKVSVCDEFCIVPAERVMQSVIFKPANVGQQSTIFVPARLHQPHEPSVSE